MLFIFLQPDSISRHTAKLKSKEWLDSLKNMRLSELVVDAGKESGNTKVAPAKNYD